MKLAIPKATLEGEARVSLIPETCTRLKKLGLDTLLETGAGTQAGFLDSDYETVGVRTCRSAEEIFGEADIFVSVHPPTNEDLSRLRSGCTLFSILNPLIRQDLVRKLAEGGITSLAMDLMPRISARRRWTS